MTLEAVIRDPRAARRILVLHDSPLRPGIGDHCRLTAQWSQIGRYFTGSTIDLWVDSDTALAIHTGNPNYREVRKTNYRGEDLGKYELVLALVLDEEELAEHAGGVTIGGLGARYYARKLLYRPAFPSAVSILEGYEQWARDRPDQRAALPGRIHLSASELDAADAHIGGAVAIFIDDASTPEKLMAPSQYFEFLRYYLRTQPTDVLVYGDKRAVYAPMLTGEELARVRFHPGRGLRDDIAALGARAVRFVFGPDTGLVHCASAVTNTLGRDVPILCTAGRFVHMRPHDWWTGSRADCAVVREDLRLAPLAEVSEAAPLGLAIELSAAELIRYFDARIAPRLS